LCQRGEVGNTGAQNAITFGSPGGKKGLPGKRKHHASPNHYDVKEHRQKASLKQNLQEVLKKLQSQTKTNRKTDRHKNLGV